MKRNYILTSLVAALSLMVACEKEPDTYLSELKVSTSYVAIPVEGKTVEITLTAEDAWSFDKAVKVGKDEAGKDVMAETPEWLTVTPLSGEAGETVIKFTADATTDTRDAVLNISSKGKTQYINVIQMAEKTELPITPIQTVIETAAGSFRVKGTVTKVVNKQYGNFYMVDDSYQGDSFQIYGTKVDGAYPKDHAKGWDAFNIEPGDVITVEGPYSIYGSTHELVDVEIIKLEKSLIQIADWDFKTLPATDSTFKMTVKSSVSPLLVTTDADWLKVTDVEEGNVYVLTASANDYTATRTATITVKGPGALATKEVSQVGIPATGATVTEIVAMVDNSEVETLECTVIAKTTQGIVIWDGTTALYVYDAAGTKAADVKVGDNLKVWGVKKTYNGVPEIELSKDVENHKVQVFSSGNSFELPSPKDVTSEAGAYTADKAEYIKLSGVLTVSGNYYNIAIDGVDAAERQGSIVKPVDELGAKNFDGKKVTITGWFNGISGKAAPYYLNVITTKIVEFVDNPKGTLTNPYMASEIATLLKEGNTFSENVYVKGVVSKKTKYNFINEEGKKFNTASFWMSDDGKAYGVSEDGKTTTEPTKDFECYSVYYLGGDLANPTAADNVNASIELGDELIVYGAVTWYAASSVPETASKKAKIYSINGATSDENGVGNASFPFNVAGAEAFIDRMEAAKAEAAANEQPAPSFPNVCVKGKISAIAYEFSTYAGTATFWMSDDGKAYGVSDDKKSTTEPAKDFECYGIYWYNNTQWTEGKGNIAVGDEVVVKGQLTYYASKGIYETNNKQAWLYSLNGVTE